MESIEDFFHDFRQDILLSSEAEAGYQLNAFMGLFADELTEASRINGFELSYYNPPNTGLRVDGYWLDDDGVLDLFIADFNYRDRIESLPKSEIEVQFKRLSSFLTKSLDAKFRAGLELTSPEYQLADLISNRFESLHKINMFIFSERQISRQVNLDDSEIHGTKVSYEIWDINRLFKLKSSKDQKEPLDIDLKSKFGQALLSLPAYSDDTKYPSYLMVVPGEILSSLYEEFGTRLLEQNVRSFLQARGKVNKGIKATILKEPEMFFAYNNGITATAEKVETEHTEHGLAIKSITDLQIVNGGQTTASLFHTKKKEKVSLDKVLVQMKLTVISSTESEDVVPRISEYANTQNRVNAADFFSNHPFHVRMEQFSRQEWAPAVEGSQLETKWFYERARGQYADAQSTLTRAQKNKFKLENPKSQMFTKTDLAKFENVWDEHPRSVNLGAQKNFSEYAKRIGKEWAKKDIDFNRLYFKRIVARAIIFRSTEKLVSKQPWYGGGYRANIVAYTIAMLSEILRRRNKWLDILQIWQQQKISLILEETLAIIAKEIYEKLTHPPQPNQNITEWAKRTDLWDQLQERADAIAEMLPIEFYESLIDSEQRESDAKSAQTLQKIDDGIEAQTKVVSYKAERWTSLYKLLQEKSLLNSKETGILKVAMQIPNRIPSEKQSLELIKILDKASLEGFDIEKL